MMRKVVLSLLLSLAVFKQHGGFCHALSSVNPATATSATKTTSTTTTTTANPLADFDYHTEDRLPWLPHGYQSWEWQRNTNDKYKINYLELGDPTKPALLLIHGFGASAYHWRFNAPKLAQDYHVFAIDLLGFGLSDKPILEYSAELWRDQAVDFIRDIIQKPTTIAGNSLGGFTALYASTCHNQDDVNVTGCILLNGAGRFRDPENDVEVKEDTNSLVENLKAAVQRFIIQVSFVVTKQPARINQVLKQVYPVQPHRVDDELVESIRVPSLHPNAAEVFYRVITKTGSQPVYVDDLLQQLDNKIPLLLCWGEEDPWIRPQAADKVQALYPQAQRWSIDAGHCPHDEAPEEVNTAIRTFVQQVTKTQAVPL